MILFLTLNIQEMTRQILKKKILINALSALQGGGQTYILNLLYGKEHENFEVSLLVCKANKEIFEKLNNVTLIDIGEWGNGALKRTIWENFYLPSFLKEKNIDILFAPGGILPLGLKIPHTKLVTTCQNMLPFSLQQINEAEHLSLKIKFLILFVVQSLSFRKSNLVIFLSNFAQKKVSRLSRLKKNSVVIPHGLSQLFWEKRTVIDQDFVLYVSSFYKYKCQLELIKAWEQLVKLHPNFLSKLYLIGDHSTQYGLQAKKLVKKLNLEHRVEFLGLIPYKEIAGYTQSSKLNIFASTCENCPNILLEYLASENPILCSNEEPMPEFAQDSVIYFNPEDPEEIYQKLKNSLIDHKYNLNQYAQKSYQLSKNYDWGVTRLKTWEQMKFVLVESKK